MEYNHDRDLESFRPEIELINSTGYNVIAVSQVYLEDTFVFETTTDAKNAYMELEKTNDSPYERVSGWWYGKDEFLNTIKEYEDTYDFKVRVYWLK